MRFKYLVTRAFGKLRETHQVGVSPYRDLRDADLAKQIRELKTKLGVPDSEP